MPGNQALLELLNSSNADTRPHGIAQDLQSVKSVVIFKFPMTRSQSDQQMKWVCHIVALFVTFVQDVRGSVQGFTWIYHLQIYIH